MNKKIIAALLLLTIWVPVNAQAALKNQTQSVPTLAIVDTAIDTSLPIFNGKIVAEVCIMDWSLCPNGSSFMEGPGSATLPSNQISLDGFDHGTQMASAAVMSNPNMNIVFIRIFGFDPSLKGQVRNGGLCNKPAGSVYRCVNTNDVIAQALNWVSANKEKYNIKAVSMSQGSHALKPAGTNYCTNVPNVTNAVKALLSQNIPSFFATGNNRDYKRIDWPSCIPESVSVGGVDQINEILSNTNVDKDIIDFFALGATGTPELPYLVSPGGVLKNGSGTSIATQVAASNFVAIQQNKVTLTAAQVLNLMTATTSETIGKQGKFKKLVSIKSALNG
jgi:hypothetical protein